MKNYSIDDIRALKGPADIKIGFSIWPIIILVLLVSIGVFVFIYVRKKRDSKKLPPLPPKPPEDIARSSLEALLKEDLLKKGMVKEYYTALSDIIRRYIEGRFRIFALDRTTWEVYQEMRDRKIKREHIEKMRDFLEECDFVKFAKYVPSTKESEGSYNKAKEIVDITGVSKPALES